MMSVYGGDKTDASSGLVFSLLTCRIYLFFVV